MRDQVIWVWIRVYNLSHAQPEPIEGCCTMLCAIFEMTATVCCRYAIGFGDRTTPDHSPGVNGGVSRNNVFMGTRYFAMKDLPWNQFNLWFFQWTVRNPCLYL